MDVQVDIQVVASCLVFQLLATWAQWSDQMGAGLGLVVDLEL